MPQVRCPQCGAVNATGAPDYPFCNGCQDNLAKCGYCRWFDSEVAICTQPDVAGVFDVASDATPPCGQHEPREVLYAPSRSLWPIVIAGIVALLVLVYSVYQLQKPLDVPPELPQKVLELEVTGTRRATVGIPFSVMVTITNLTDETIGGIRLQVSKESALVRFKLIKLDPKPSARDDAVEWISYIYPDLAPLDKHHITLEVVPRKWGSHPFSIRLYARGTTYIGMVQLPVQVAPAPESG